MTTPAPQVDLGYITREDESLKQHVSGIKVFDPNATLEGRDVPVFFRVPESEARARVYPYIVLDFLGASRDPEREHRGTVYFDGHGYIPPNMPAGGDLASTDFPIPMLLRWQVSATSRFYQHDRQIVTQLMSGPLEPRFAAVEIVGSRDAPDDNSIRRLDIEDGPRPTVARDDDGKRLFRHVWTVAMSSEMFLADIIAVNRPLAVVLDPPPPEAGSFIAP